MNGKNGSKVQIAREKLNKVLTKLNELVIGHEVENKMILLTLVAHENAVLISPPGTAKTYTLHTLAKLINAKFYMYLLTRFTSDIELFGVFNVKKIIDEGKLERNWSDIVNADIVFLDEIFKASSSILNALLSFLNERIIYDPLTGTAVKIKAISIFGASNEVPSEEELQALYDRFSIRIFLDYLSDDQLILKAMESYWLNDSKIEPIANVEDVKLLNKFAIEIIKSDIKGLGSFLKVVHKSVIPFVMGLRSKGIIMSDRTIIQKIPKLIASYCALFGLTLDNIVNSFFEIVPFMARDKSEQNDVKKFINEMLGEVSELYQKLENARIKAKAGDLASAEKLLLDIINYDIGKIAQKPWLRNRIEVIIHEARQLLNKIQRIKKEIELENENRSGE